MLSPKSLIGRRRAPRRSQSDDSIGTRRALWPVGTISQLFFFFFSPSEQLLSLAQTFQGRAVLFLLDGRTPSHAVP